MEKQIIYVGKGKTINGQYGDFENINIELDVLLKHATTAANGKKYVNITVSKKRETDQYGYDLKVVLNQFDKKEEGNTSSSQMPDREATNDLPF